MHFSLHQACTSFLLQFEHGKRLQTLEDLIGAWWHSFYRASIEQRHYYIYCFSPKSFRKTFIIQYTFSHCHHYLIFPFRNLILLWWITNGYLALHAFLFTKFFQCIWSVVFPMITSHIFDVVATLFFNEVIDVLKKCKHLGSFFHYASLSHSYKIINKEDEIFVTPTRGSWHRSAYAYMN